MALMIGSQLTRDHFRSADPNTTAAAISDGAGISSIVSRQEADYDILESMLRYQLIDTWTGGWPRYGASILRNDSVKHHRHKDFERC